MQIRSGFVADCSATLYTISRVFADYHIHCSSHLVESSMYDVTLIKMKGSSKKKVMSRIEQKRIEVKARRVGEQKLRQIL